MTLAHGRAVLARRSLLALSGATAAALLAGCRARSTSPAPAASATTTAPASASATMATPSSSPAATAAATASEPTVQLSDGEAVFVMPIPAKTSLGTWLWDAVPSGAVRQLSSMMTTTGTGALAQKAQRIVLAASRDSGSVVVDFGLTGTAHAMSGTGSAQSPSGTTSSGAAAKAGSASGSATLRGVLERHRYRLTISGRRITAVSDDLA